MKRLLGLSLALCLCGWTSLARAVPAGEDFASPSFARVDKANPGASLLQFKVKAGPVASIAVEVKTYAKGGRCDTQVFQLTPGDDRGDFPSTPGYRMWESNKIYAALDQWKDRASIDRVEFTYVVHAVGADQQRAPMQSGQIYSFARPGEWARAGAPAAIARNTGRALDKIDPRDVQAAVDHLAKNPPAGRYKALPGFYPHPLHAENDLARQIERTIKAKRQHPERSYFIKFTVYNHDSVRLSNLLADAKRAGVEVEGLTDWSQVTPRLAGKPAFETLRSASIPMTSLVRNGPGGDIRTNHTKVWLFGERDGGGKIANGTVFDCSFNTEFSNYPANQEAMTVFANNKHVATVYNHMFEAMKGNAPLRLLIDPGKARFIANHPLFPYVDKTNGRAFDAREALNLFLSKPKKNLTLLDFVVYDRQLADHVAWRAKNGVNVQSFHNRWKAKNESDGNIQVMRNGGVNAHLVGLRDNDGSPVHHKEGQADGKWARGGSLNIGDWSFQSDESMYVIKSGKLASQIRAQGNRLAHSGYRVESVRGSKLPPRLTQNVQFEVRVPKGIGLNDIAGVYFAGGGSPEMDSKWVKLDAIKQQSAQGKDNVFRGSRQLPQGFNHNGRAVIKLRDGRELWSTRKNGQQNEVFFTVDPRASGRQRIKIGGF
jgi:phosphatidylserine/phosphatidylglycerophosphate/cardiolipin synthase-like enzyme